MSLPILELKKHKDCVVCNKGYLPDHIDYVYFNVFHTQDEVYVVCPVTKEEEKDWWDRINECNIIRAEQYQNRNNIYS